MPGEEKDDAPAKKKSEGITVYLRMRPTKHPSKFYDVGDNEGRGQSLRWDIPADAVTKDGEYINNTKTQWAFKFDQVLPMDISQAQVFDRVGKHVVQNALDGYNSTVFAYGQTGSGKTFTITGGSERYEDRGIIPRALSMIFQAFRDRSDCSWSAHVSYMEIYNEQGFDLLNESSGAKNLQDLPRVRMMEDEHGKISASRGDAVPSRHRRDSCPSDEVVGGFIFDFGAVRTASMASSRDQSTQATSTCATSRCTAPPPRRRPSISYSWEIPIEQFLKRR